MRPMGLAHKFQRCGACVTGQGRARCALPAMPRLDAKHPLASRRQLPWRHGDQSATPARSV